VNDREQIRDHGKIVTAPAGTSESEIAAKLTGADQLPEIGQELGRAPEKPDFDPHAGHEHVRPMVATLVFTGTDSGGDFEQAVQHLIETAEELGLIYVTAAVDTLEMPFQRQ
jgi:hypothetical protein